MVIRKQEKDKVEKEAKQKKDKTRSSLLTSKLKPSKKTTIIKKSSVKVKEKTKEKKLLPKAAQVKDIAVAKLSQKKSKIDVVDLEKKPKQDLAQDEVAIIPDLKQEGEIKQIKEIIGATTKEQIKKEVYIETMGKRKTAKARVRVVQKGKGIFLVNNRQFDEYCPNIHYRKGIEMVLEMIRKAGNRPDITVIVTGGGFHAQIEAIRHGIAKILAKIDEKAKIQLKQLGYLTRDARRRERKKPGLKRARKATQWRKR
jgi:small subunit ribosomal protein S9